MIVLFGFPIFLIYIHLTTLALIAGLVVFADHQAWLWMRGEKETLSSNIMKRIHYATWTGLLIMIGTGIAIALPLKDFLLTNTAFFFKMFFVSALVLNAVVIGFLMKVATERAFASLSLRERIPLLVSGGVSTAGWIGAVVSAFSMGL